VSEAGAAVQTIWAELIAASLADAGVVTCVVSPGSRSTPLVAALAGEPRLALVTLIDERAAAFYALGAARATAAPAALVCTSGTAAAHYLPAIVEASLAGVPLVALTADRPPELQACGASQTIDQIGLYGGYVRAALDLGAPAPGERPLRAVRRKLVQAIALARGPRPGPVHVEVPLRKPLEPAAPATDDERALARAAAALRGPAVIAPPRLAADPDAVEQLAAAIAREPAGVIVAGALPPSFGAAREAVLALAARAGYPVIAEAASQLRLGPPPDGVARIDHFDLIPPARLPEAGLVIELGAEPVAAGWPAWIGRAKERWILAGAAWRDPDSTARAVLLGEPDEIVRRLAARLAGAIAGAIEARPRAWAARWQELERAAAAAAAAAIEAHPGSEVAVLRAALDALPAGAMLQVGNSLPIRAIDHVPAHAPARAAGPRPPAVLSQRGAAGIDGLIASAAGATRAGAPVLLALGDVSFAHDLGGLLAARAAAAPLAILVLDNGGGQIFAGLPVARAGLGAALDAHWLTAPGVDPAAVARALGLPAVTAATPAAAARAVAEALARPGATVIHAPVTPSGARDVRRAAIELCATGAPA
jgi:2-succinyl-5-enolpyruvyl-6-hydroxy-3-cyclohexene-1-carboxylate synthase